MVRAGRARDRSTPRPFVGSLGFARCIGPGRKFAARVQPRRHRLRAPGRRRDLRAPRPAAREPRQQAALRARAGVARRDRSRASLERLREEGYATLPFSELVPDPAVWNELEPDAARFVAETEAGLASEQEGGESALRRRAGKEFLVRKYSWDVELGLDDPWLRLGSNPRLLDLANAYLEMWSKLEYVDVWYTPPAGGDERRSSQRWHRDFNDRHLLKAFVYLVDVDEETGPFEYVPRSAPGGELEALWPWRPLGDNYPPEDELAEQIGRPLGHVHGPEGRRSSSATPRASTAAALRAESRACSRPSPGTRRRR